MQRLDRLKETPSQTAGPYVHNRHEPQLGRDHRGMGRRPRPRADGARGRRRTRPGQGSGSRRRRPGAHPMRSSRSGRRMRRASTIHPEEKRGAADPHFVGWGRQPTDAKTGEFRFETIKPGRVPSPTAGSWRPTSRCGSSRGAINIGLHTRMYFGDEQAANAEDPVLARIEHRARVETLIAPRSEEHGSPAIPSRCICRASAKRCSSTSDRRSTSTPGTGHDEDGRRGCERRRGRRSRVSASAETKDEQKWCSPSSSASPSRDRCRARRTTRPCRCRRPSRSNPPTRRSRRRHARPHPCP